jgi:hypothetical protein
MPKNMWLPTMCTMLLHAFIYFWIHNEITGPRLRRQLLRQLSVACALNEILQALVSALDRNSIFQTMWINCTRRASRFEILLMKYKHILLHLVWCIRLYGPANRLTCYRISSSFHITWSVFNPFCCFKYKVVHNLTKLSRLYRALRPNGKRGRVSGNNMLSPGDDLISTPIWFNAIAELYSRVCSLYLVALSASL